MQVCRTIVKYIVFQTLNLSQSMYLLLKKKCVVVEPMKLLSIQKEKKKKQNSNK